MNSRQLWVDAGRLERWVTGFGERHGEVELDGSNERIVLSASDGAKAVLWVTFPLFDGPRVDVPEVVRNALEQRTLAVLLVRRGGYACALVEGTAVLASKVGSRYVQGRTAAGGWSQQRFARRREGQANALIGSVIEVAQRVLTGDGPRPGWLITGGDRPLVEQVLGDPRLVRLARLPRGPHLEVPDPRSDVVRALPANLRKVRVTLTEP